MIVDIVIPAYNEEAALPLVLGAIPKALVRHVVVADNNSRDRSAEVARAHGAVVVPAPRQGYGSACLAGMAWVAAQPLPPDVLVFLDADFSDHPDELPLLLAPIQRDGADLVIGSRALGQREAGSMTLPQRFGNWLATRLIRWIYGYRFTDLGPFRAVRYAALLGLGMDDPDFGWTVEMQVRAAKQGLRCAEVPVSYRRRRHGASKVSGTLRGAYLAGQKILYTIFRLM